MEKTETPDRPFDEPVTEKNHTKFSSAAGDGTHDQLNSPTTKLSPSVNAPSTNDGTPAPLDDVAGALDEDMYMDWDAPGNDSLATEPMKEITPVNLLPVPSSPHAIDIKPTTDSDIASEDEEVIVEAGGVARWPPAGTSINLPAQSLAETATHINSGTFNVKDDLLKPKPGIITSSHQQESLLLKPSPVLPPKETANSPGQNIGALVETPIKSIETESLSEVTAANDPMDRGLQATAETSSTRPKGSSDVVARIPPNIKEIAGEAMTEGKETREILVTNSEALEMKGRPEFDLGYFIYNPSQLLPSFIEKENGVFDVQVPAAFLTYENLKVRRRAIWGTDVYTDDSDVVAMAVHTGKYSPSFPSELSSKDGQPALEIPDHDIKIRLRVLPKLLRYTGCTRHRIKSRDWGDHDGVSLKVENVTLMPLGAATEIGRKNRKRRIDEHNLARKRIMAAPELDHIFHHYASGAVVKDKSLIFHKQLDPCWKYTRPWQEGQKHRGKSVETCT